MLSVHLFPLYIQAKDIKLGVYVCSLFAAAYCPVNRFSVGNSGKNVDSMPVEIYSYFLFAVGYLIVLRPNANTLKHLSCTCDIVWLAKKIPATSLLEIYAVHWFKISNALLLNDFDK